MQVAVQARKPRKQASFGSFWANYIYGVCIKDNVFIDKIRLRLIQKHDSENAVNPPFLGGFFISGMLAA